MLLVNGARGIGTGYSTYIPPCNPATIKARLQRWLKGDVAALDEALPPYFRGFKGTIADGEAVGVHKMEGGDAVITELPPGTWTADYREFLEKELAEGRIKDFVDTSTDVAVNIRVKGMETKTLIKSLTEKIKTTNMHAFNHKGIITKYATPNDILKEYAEVRLALYETRRQHQMKTLRNELPYHDNVVRFIEDQIKDVPVIVLKKKTRLECDKILFDNKYAQIEGGYDYIMKLPVSSFTAEQVAKHEAKLAALRAEIAQLERLEAADMWLADLQHIDTK
jgi:DNA topoisomerase-2